MFDKCAAKMRFRCPIQIKYEFLPQLTRNCIQIGDRGMCRTAVGERWQVICVCQPIVHSLVKACFNQGCIVPMFASRCVSMTKWGVSPTTRDNLHYFSYNREGASNRIRHSMPNLISPLPADIRLKINSLDLNQLLSFYKSITVAS